MAFSAGAKLLAILFVCCSCEWYQSIAPMDHSEKQSLKQVTMDSSKWVYDLPLQVTVDFHKFKTTGIWIYANGDISFDKFFMRITTSVNNVLTSLQYWIVTSTSCTTSGDPPTTDCTTTVDYTTVRGTINTEDGGVSTWYLRLFGGETFNLEIQTNSTIKSMLCEESGCYQTLLPVGSYSICEKQHPCTDNLKSCKDEESCRVSFPECIKEGRIECQQPKIIAAIVGGTMGGVFFIVFISITICMCRRGLCCCGSCSCPSCSCPSCSCSCRCPWSRREKEPSSVVRKNVHSYLQKESELEIQQPTINYRV